jgi:hypothetical protein
MIADKAEAAFGMEMVAVEADDAGRFLAAMLKGVQAERGQRRGIGVVEDAEDAALLVQTILFEPVRFHRQGVHGHGPQASFQ